MIQLLFSYSLQNIHKLLQFPWASHICSRFYTCFQFCFFYLKVFRSIFVGDLLFVFLQNLQLIRKTLKKKMNRCFFLILPCCHYIYLIMGIFQIIEDNKLKFQISNPSKTALFQLYNRICLVDPYLYGLMILHFCFLALTIFANLSSLLSSRYLQNDLKHNIRQMKLSILN